jgi:hypothetical protein
MKYQTGKIYMHPDVPGKVMAALAECQPLDSADCDSLQFYRPDLIQLIRHPVPIKVFSTTDDMPESVTFQRILFKRKQIFVTVYECVQGE